MIGLFLRLSEEQLAKLEVLEIVMLKIVAQHPTMETPKIQVGKRETIESEI